MATATPTQSSSPRPVGQPLRVPPDDTMWTKYSAHGEAPLSFVGSAATHILAFVLVGVIAFLAYMGWIFSKPPHDLPVDTVRMPGGGGGNPKGEGNGSGIGTGGEDVTGNNQDPQPVNTDDVKRPPLTVEEAKAFIPDFKGDPAAVRFVEEGNENFKKLARLNENMRNTLRDGVNPGKGEGGAGKGGGKGTGEGTGTGPGVGSGKALSVREKRSMRWSMSFNRGTYLEQLRDLGAIIAVPVGRDGKHFQVCDLTKQPLRWTDSDLSDNTRIFWIDDKPDSVGALMTQMGRPGHVSHFVALLPPDLEAKLFDLELKFKNRAEDDIYETKFECFPGANGKYDVRVKSQTPK